MGFLVHFEYTLLSFVVVYLSIMFSILFGYREIWERNLRKEMKIEIIKVCCSVPFGFIGVCAFHFFD